MATLASLAACGGGGSSDAGSAVMPPVAPPPPPPPPTSVQAARFLHQAQFSASAADIAAVQAKGFGTWLDEQMSAPSGPGGWDWLVSKGYNDVAFANHIYPADYMAWQQLITRPDAVRVRMALALSEIFVVSSNSMSIAGRSMAMAAYWDLLCTHAFGNYRDLLGAITLNPAMGNYLNLRGSRKADSTGRQPDENYAREVMQLFSIGLYQLNIDGSVKTTAGNPVETYGPSVVSDLAKVFTGWDYDNTGSGASNPTHLRNPLVCNASRHATDAVTVLGASISGGSDGSARLKQALDAIFAHPNVGPFIAKQLIQRLVTSNPSLAYVARVASVFNHNGAGVRGDLRAVFKAIVLDEEARSDTVAAQPTWGKLREPIVRFVQWARTFKAKSSTGDWKLGDFSDPATRLSQSPLRSPSVFNFFRPGYVPPNTSLSTANLLAPEFQIANESSVAGYLNFMQNVVRSGFADMTPTYDEELALVQDVNALTDRLNLTLCAGALTAATLQTIREAVGSIAATTAAGQQNRLYAAILLTMAAPQYLVQK